jgi:aerobic-type carbon monoxide dehydrogenase small subunit (CoxS/CutS family)
MQGCVQLAYPFASDFIGFASRCRSGLKPCGESTMSSLILNINGAKMPVDAPGDETLLSVLRNRLALTGTKYGCGEGECGACTVLLDGKAVKSCQTLVSEAAGARITTVEGLEQNGRLTPVQQAFVDAGAYQCGFCTSGMVMRATALLAATPRPTQAEIVARMNGNVCRCGTYPRIVDAVQRASMSSTKGGAR